MEVRKLVLYYKELPQGYLPSDGIVPHFYWEEMCIRDRTYTIGDLSIDGKFFCNTIEDAVRELPATLSLIHI